jgi:hypothetical protein
MAGRFSLTTKSSRFLVASVNADKAVMIIPRIITEARIGLLVILDLSLSNRETELFIGLISGCLERTDDQVQSQRMAGIFSGSKSVMYSTVTPRCLEFQTSVLIYHLEYRECRTYRDITHRNQSRSYEVCHKTESQGIETISDGQYYECE